jgi:predicted nuclease with TOPRIM domain
LLDEVQEGFAQINEAQGRVNTLDKNLEGSNAKANIQDNMLFIEQTLEEQRQKIENLQKKVDDGIITSGKLKSMIENLQNQLTEKSKDIEGLRAQLAEKDIQIENLGKSVTQLQTENEQVKEESENRAQIVRNQDTQLNTAYFVYGTNKELKEHKILQSGDVLANNDFDRDYFTKIDIRKTTVIPFGSKSAKLLTTHPEGSYTLLKDSKGEYTLRITDPNKFWSVSKYLVVRVK